MRAQLEGLAGEKDAILAELTELRQEELRVLYSLGKNLRDTLADKLNETLKELEQEIESKLSAFKSSLTASESQAIQSVEILRKSLKEKLPRHIESVQKETGTEKQELLDFQTKQHEALSNEAGENLKKLVDHGAALKEKLQTLGLEHINSLDAALEKLTAEQSEKLKQKVDSIAALQERTLPEIQASMDDLERMPKMFAETCKQISERQLKLHGTQVSNIAMVYKSEISSVKRESDDLMLIARGKMHSVLRSYHEYYVEQTAKLLSRFEESAKEAKPENAGKVSSSDDDELPQSVIDSFGKMRQELNEKAKSFIATAGSNMEASLEKFRSRLNEASQSASKKIESASEDCRKEISSRVESNDRKLDEMRKKADALEQLVEEAKELISALDQSNLDF